MTSVENVWWWETGAYHVHLTFQCIYGGIEEGGKGGDGKRWEIAWPLVCR